MRLTLSPQEATGPWRVREVALEDADALGRLFLEAYRGTVDDEGETLDGSVAEVRDTLAGKYGAFLGSCSFVIEDRSAPVCATLVTLWEGRPLLAYMVTHPDQQRRGMGTFLIKRSVNTLQAQGYEELELFVTRANQSAIRIYERLGFRDVEGWSLPD
jgi:ribosomal protein S18 acetylase RimI-like enzyme